MFSSEEVGIIAQEIAQEYEGFIKEKKDSFEVKLSSNNKQLYIDWPKHDLAEVWVTFQKDGQELYQDWFECMEKEDKNEFIQYIKSIPKKYFGNQVRVKRHGVIFHRYILEYKNGDTWRDLLAE